MFVSDWMTRKTFTVTPDSSVYEVVKLMREKRLKHIPVVRDDRLKGIVSDRDIRQFLPSQATTLDVYELHYLLEKIRIKEIMTKEVITTTSDTPIEEAAIILYDEDIGCLPVFDNDRLTGILCDRDIFRALVDITGARHHGHRICLTAEDRPGSIREIADIVRKHGFGLQGILTSYEGVKSGYRNIVIRTKGSGSFGAMKAELMGSFKNVRITKG